MSAELKKNNFEIVENISYGACRYGRMRLKWVGAVEKSELR